MGWDTLDLVKANVMGWETEIFFDLGFRHHRPEGKRDGHSLRTWTIQGEASHYMDYRISYLFARTLFQASGILPRLGSSPDMRAHGFGGSRAAPIRSSGRTYAGSSVFVTFRSAHERRCDPGPCSTRLRSPQQTRPSHSTSTSSVVWLSSLSAATRLKPRCAESAG